MGGSAFSAEGAGGGDMTDINNEIYKLSSSALVGTAVDSLKLNVLISKPGPLTEKFVSIDSIPFSLTVKRADKEAESPEYALTLSQNSYKIESEIVNASGRYGQPVIINGDTVNINLIRPLMPEENKFGFRFMRRSDMIGAYIERIAVYPIPKGGPGMLMIAVKDEFPARAEQIIKVLIHHYDISNLDFKNQALRVEMDFLENRLATVTKDLEQQQNAVSAFKSSNKINDVSTSATEMLTSLQDIDKKKNENTFKNNLLNLIEGNIKNAKDRDVVLNANGVQDAVLLDLVNKYNTAVSEKNAILDGGAPKDPRLDGLTARITDYKTNILSNVGSIRQEIITNNSFLSAQEKNTSGRFTTLPEKEQDFISVNRLLGIKQSLYMFLLQKTEDKKIELASATIAESRIIDSTMSNFTREPKPLMIYATALALGLIIPAIVILIRTLMNQKIDTRKDIEAATKLPIAGEISFVKNASSNMVITAESVTPEAEQFRSLRTNIAYISKGTSSKVLLITSSTSQEGKSFVSLNMANSYAIRNKKVALLEFDLRDPGLSEKIGLDDTLGLANYLAGETTLDEIIQTLPDYENLSFISSGTPLPVNPGEIILNNRMQSLFESLKEKFDVIIVDTPPVGLVSDALSLGKWADLSFFVVRHKYSLRQSLKLLNQLKDEQRLPYLSIIINGIKNRSFNNGSKYAYGYGYGYGAGDKKNKKRKRLSAKTG